MVYNLLLSGERENGRAVAADRNFGSLSSGPAADGRLPCSLRERERNSSLFFLPPLSIFFLSFFFSFRVRRFIGNGRRRPHAYTRARLALFPTSRFGDKNERSLTLYSSEEKRWESSRDRDGSGGGMPRKMREEQSGGREKAQKYRKGYTGIPSRPHTRTPTDRPFSLFAA